MKELFGYSKGRAVHKYILTNKNGMKAELLDFGAILHSLQVPVGAGGYRDVVLACRNMEGYEDNKEAFGSTVGPVANRTAGGLAVIGGRLYRMEKNDGENNLHSSTSNGIHKRLWKAKEDKNSVCFTISLEDGELGLPGYRTIELTYTLEDDNRLVLDFNATTDRKTIFNLTNHSYFNLMGHNHGTVEDHILRINADRITVIDEHMIPTGEIRDIKNTELDFTASKRIGRDINSHNRLIQIARGYDFNYCINNNNEVMTECAILEAPDGKVKLHLLSTLPGLQLYTGNYIDNKLGKDNTEYGEKAGVALETQYYPDSINHDNFTNIVFDESHGYSSTTIFAF